MCSKNPSFPNPERHVCYAVIFLKPPSSNYTITQHCFDDIHSTCTSECVPEMHGGISTIYDCCCIGNVCNDLDFDNFTGTYNILCCPSVCLSVCSSVCLSVRLSACPSVCLLATNLLYTWAGRWVLGMEIRTGYDMNPRLWIYSVLEIGLGNVPLTYSHATISVDTGWEYRFKHEFMFLLINMLVVGWFDCMIVSLLLLLLCVCICFIFTLYRYTTNTHCHCFSYVDFKYAK